VSDYIVNLKIGNKDFSLRTQSPQGELVLRRAAELVNQRFEARSNTAGADTLDLLRMTSFDLAVEIVRLLDEQSDTEKNLDAILKRVTGMA
jgi:hypothetical protein